eukprot:Blabericola_migrator_1__7178@NODE_363_length_9424_cov_115_493427_g284_i1_p5_GENE_NODE_363_length_9424_cov_115_493427_g284_i1NODE_363_length_9424_cov_115_493427_g284_i1_p5_ORF_typecomplete_len145_score19_86Iron_permease/PF04120_12/0_27_NODE_363_length_9424_cov_115_493427_g284_i136864120
MVQTGGTLGLGRDVLCLFQNHVACKASDSSGGINIVTFFKVCELFTGHHMRDIYCVRNSPKGMCSIMASNEFVINTSFIKIWSFLKLVSKISSLWILLLEHPLVVVSFLMKFLNSTESAFIATLIRKVAFITKSQGAFCRQLPL